MTGELTEKGRKLVGGKLEANEAWERRNVVRLIASNAHNPADFVHLVGLLGISPEDGRNSARRESL